MHISNSVYFKESSDSCIKFLFRIIKCIGLFHVYHETNIILHARDYLYYEHNSVTYVHLIVQWLKPQTQERRGRQILWKQRTLVCTNISTSTVLHWILTSLRHGMIVYIIAWEIVQLLNLGRSVVLAILHIIWMQWCITRIS